MALQTIDGAPLWYPAPWGGENGPLAGDSDQINAAGEAVAWVLSCTKAGNIAKVHFYVNAVASSGDVDVSIETVSLVNGDPTGTDFDTDSHVDAFTVDAGVGWYTATLNDLAAVGLGDRFAVVITDNASSTPDISILSQSSDASATVFPYKDVFTGSWAKGAKWPNIVLEFNDGSIMPGIGSAAFGANNLVIVDTDAVPDEYGNIFTVPFTCRAMGFWVHIDADADAVVNLFDSDGSTSLATAAIDTNIRGSANNLHVFPSSFDAAAVLSINTSYRMAIRSNSSSSFALAQLNVAAASHLDVLSGGSGIHMTTRNNNTGAWTETTTSRIWMGLIIDQLDDGVGGGGGGGMMHPAGWRGGFDGYRPLHPDEAKEDRAILFGLSESQRNQLAAQQMRQINQGLRKTA